MKCRENWGYIRKNWAYTEFVLKKYPIKEMQSEPSILQSIQKCKRRKAKRVILVLHKLYYAASWDFFLPTVFRALQRDVI